MGNYLMNQTGGDLILIVLACESCWRFTVIDFLSLPYATLCTYLSLRYFRRRKEHRVDGHAKITARFFLACKPNPDTRVKIPPAIRAKGYSNEEAADQILIQQVHCKVKKIRGENIPDPPEAATTATRCLWPCWPHQMQESDKHLR